jgi:hypothetical protein
MTSEAPNDRLLGLEVLEHAVPYKLYRLAIRGTQAKSAYIKRRVGLAIDEWKVLLLIGSFSPLSTKEVAARSTLDKVRVSRTTMRLVKKGLVTAARDQGDRRKVDRPPANAGTSYRSSGRKVLIP